MIITKENLQEMDRIPRLNLVNSLSGFKSANLVGTISNTGQTNLAIFSSAVHVGSNPPLLGLVVRPPVVPRHSYDNIRATGVYTLNHVHEEYLEAAHQTSGKYPVDVSEFDACGFETGYVDDFSAPYVMGSTVTLGMALVEELAIKTNQCQFLIGEIQWIRLADGLIKDNGTLDLVAAKTVALAGLDSYHRALHIKDMPYVSRKQIGSKGV